MHFCLYYGISKKITGIHAKYKLHKNPLCFRNRTDFFFWCATEDGNKYAIPITSRPFGYANSIKSWSKSKARIITARGLKREANTKGEGDGVGGGGGWWVRGCRRTWMRDGSGRKGAVRGVYNTFTEGFSSFRIIAAVTLDPPLLDRSLFRIPFFRHDPPQTRLRDDPRGFPSSFDRQNFVCC